jgi:hypothetical protein
LARFTVYNKITSPEKLALVNKDNKDLGNEWLDYLASVDRAQSTIKGYRNDLDIFWCWNLEHNKNKDFAKLTKRDIAKFQNHAINVWGGVLNEQDVLNHVFLLYLIISKIC